MSAETEDGADRPDGVPLSWRILAVNIFAVALLAGGLFYLDNYRAALVEQQTALMARDIAWIGQALRMVPPESSDRFIDQFAATSHTRIRRFAADGTLEHDSARSNPAPYVLQDPDTQPWQRHVARALDRGIDASVGAAIPETIAMPEPEVASAWPEIAAARAHAMQPVTRYRFAPDRTPFLSAAMADERGNTLFFTSNARDITRTVRAERFQWGLVLLSVLLLSILLSLFLARTIVRPLQLLASAATQVRLGRAREVTVPRLPQRRDEIGQLARALSDMTTALRARIDAGEAFAADVAHEVKNPLASLRSALESLETVEQPALRQQLLAIGRDDVVRLDRLISDISEASRLDAELSRARFARVDLGSLVGTLIAARRERGQLGSVRLAYARSRSGAVCVDGDAGRLARVIDNLLDNALSFSPPGGVVRVTVTRSPTSARLVVEDEGPGVSPSERQAIFRRFHSHRPHADEFGNHSGLGLSIARTIVEAHDGSISCRDRADGEPGAAFEVQLPISDDCDG